MSLSATPRVNAICGFTHDYLQTVRVTAPCLPAKVIIIGLVAWGYGRWFRHSLEFLLLVQLAEVLDEGNGHFSSTGKEAHDAAVGRPGGGDVVQCLGLVEQFTAASG